MVGWAVGLNSSEPNSQVGEFDESKEGGAGLVVAGGDAVEPRELAEEALDMIARPPVEGLLPAELFGPGWSGLECWGARFSSAS